MGSLAGSWETIPFSGAAAISLSLPRRVFPWRGSEAAPFLEPLGFLSARRYQLAVTKYQEAERFHSSLYNQNHHWAYPMVFEDFVHNNENIKDEVLIQSPLPTLGLVTNQ